MSKSPSPDDQPKANPKLPAGVRFFSSDIGAKDDIGSQLRNAHRRTTRDGQLAPTGGGSRGAGLVVLALVLFIIALAALVVFILVKATS